ncbi:hypothetical protein D3C72_768670 [compost metagenome]
MVALLGDVLLDQLAEVRGIGVRRGAQIEFGLGLVRNDIGDLVTDCGGGHATHIQRRILQRLLIIGADFLRLRDANPGLQRFLVVRHGGHDPALGIAETNLGVVARNGDATAIVLHRA